MPDSVAQKPGIGIGEGEGRWCCVLSTTQANNRLTGMGMGMGMASRLFFVETRNKRSEIYLYLQKLRLTAIKMIKDGALSHYLSPSSTVQSTLVP